MSEATISPIEERFVELALSHNAQEWMCNNVQLTEAEVNMLFELVLAAGFEPKQIVLGKLIGNYCEQDGSRTGETFGINRICPFKVTNQDGKDDYFATGWLDCALRLALSDRWNRQEIVAAIQKERERSVPFTPIPLTNEGDALQEYSREPNGGGFEYFVEHQRDDHSLYSCVGAHRYCHGFVDRHRATDSHDALVCRKCHLRVLFAKEVKTYGELRQAMAAKLAADEGRLNALAWTLG